MPDIHASVGHLTLTGKVLMGYADSDDVGEQTDATAAVADVQIKASIPRVVVTANEDVINLPTINGSLNGEGQLVAPADGKSTTGTSTSMRLIAPQQASISHVNWHWEVTVRPIEGTGVIFEPITVIVTGAPGDAKTIGGEILAGHVPGLSQLLAAIDVTGTGVDDELTLDDIPDGTPLGTVVANTAVTPTAFYIYR